MRDDCDRYRRDDGPTDRGTDFAFPPAGARGTIGNRPRSPFFGFDRRFAEPSRHRCGSELPLMEHRSLTLDELATELGRDRREVEKAVQRGSIPGRKHAGQWQFDPAEITQWLEQEIRGYSDEQLQVLEGSQHSEEVQSDLP